MEVPSLELGEGIEEDSNECCDILSRVFCSSLNSPLIGVWSICTWINTYYTLPILGKTPANVNRLVDENDICICVPGVGIECCAVGILDCTGACIWRDEGRAVQDASVSDSTPLYQVPSRDPGMTNSQDLKIIASTCENSGYLGSYLH